MTYWQRTKRTAWFWITGWRIIPRHIADVAEELVKAIWNLLGALVSAAMLLVCVIAPLLFWAAPLLVLVVQKLEKAEEARRKKEREEAIRSMTSLAQTEDRQ